MFSNCSSENYILEFIGHFLCYLWKQLGHSIALISAVTYINIVFLPFFKIPKKILHPRRNLNRLRNWGFHQTTALIVSKSFLFSTVDLLGGTVKPQVYKVFKVAKQKLLKWLWKMQKQQHINQIFLCSSSSGHWPRFLFWNCLLQCKKNNSQLGSIMFYIFKQIDTK